MGRGRQNNVCDNVAEFREIRKVLEANNCDYEQRERYLLLCVHGDPNSDTLVQWEMEVSGHCGVRFRLRRTDKQSRLLSAGL
jgi:hypothetical protein